MSKLLHMRAVCDRYGVADRTLYRWVEAGELPKPCTSRGAATGTSPSSPSVTKHARRGRQHEQVAAPTATAIRLSSKALAAT